MSSVVSSDQNGTDPKFVEFRATLKKAVCNSLFSTDCFTSPGPTTFHRVDIGTLPPCGGYRPESRPNSIPVSSNHHAATNMDDDVAEHSGLKSVSADGSR